MKTLTPFLVLLVCAVGGVALGIATIGRVSGSPTAAPETIHSTISVLESRPTSPTAAPSPKLLAEIRKVSKELAQIKADNRTLRRQLAETNRDLAELQFQVDSHSESFRPLDGGFDGGSASPLNPRDLQPLLPPR